MPKPASFDPEYELRSHQEAVIATACVHFVRTGMVPVDVAIELQEAGISVAAFIDWVTEHPRYQPITQ
jgi:hypothetical protein